MDSIRITWLGHACFKLTCGKHSVVIDPYRDVPGYPPLVCSAGRVYASHTHHDDHGYFEAVDIVKESGESPFKVETIDCFHDDKQGSLRGKNRITIFEAAGVRIAHFGDLGHMLSRDIIDRLKGIDVAMLPVGGYYTIDGPQAYEIMMAIDPKITIPMHYRKGALGFDVLSGPDEFSDLVNDRKVITSSSNFLEISGGNPEKSVVLLTFKGPENE